MKKKNDFNWNLCSQNLKKKLKLSDGIDKKLIFKILNYFFYYIEKRFGYIMENKL